MTEMFFSGTAKIRDKLAKYCKGKGIDIACGIEKIVPEAVGIDFPRQYALSDHPETVADFKVRWEDYLATRREDEFDYIYSSHLLEDYEDPYEILVTWSKYVKLGGLIVLALPIEEAFKHHCEVTGQIYNNHHKQNWKGADDFLAKLPAGFSVVDSSKGVEPIVDYNFFVVLQKEAL